MTHSSDRLSDYRHQGQQDDYFEQDLATAGGDPTTEVAANQAPQDDYFVQDLEVAGNEPKANTPSETELLETYRDQGQQDDYFEQDLTNRDRSGLQGQ